MVGRRRFDPGETGARVLAHNVIYERAMLIRLNYTRGALGLIWASRSVWIMNLSEAKLDNTCGLGWYNGRINEILYQEKI